MICKKKKLKKLSFLNNCELFFFALIKSVIWNIRMNWSLVVYTLEYPFFKLITYIIFSILILLFKKYSGSQSTIIFAFVNFILSISK